MQECGDNQRGNGAAESSKVNREFPSILHQHVLSFESRVVLSNSKGKGGRGKVQGKGECPRENWEKVQVLRICRGVGVVPSRVIWDEYRN